jgi:UDP-N-acetylmuramoylalanine--D-glutamate ligase
MRTLVVGAAISGKAAAGLAARLGHEVIAYDRDAAAAARLRETGVDSRSGGWDPEFLEGVDLVVTSPGVPPRARVIVDSLDAGVTVWSELEFAAQQATAPLLAVTGTNGKTSTVRATTAMLEASGAKVCAAGNVGTALSDVAQDPWDVIVVEASSFQLRFTETFHPQGAAILNISPDHLDWHRTFDAYVTAKARITANQTAGDLLAYGADDPAARRAAETSRARRVPVSGDRLPRSGAGVDDGELRIFGIDHPAPDLGPDFLADLAAAAVLARHGGASETGIREGIDHFEPGPHRRRTIGVWDEVRWVNDSKATNPHAAAASASAFSSVVLIAGGRNKGLDLSPLAELPSVRHVVAIGESADEIVALFAAGRVSRAESLEDAVALADALASPGDTVLLAPGCASFDMFDSYAERGDLFTSFVRGRKAVAHGQ